MRNQEPGLAVADGVAQPGLSDASDGVPQAAASMTVIPHPSFGDGKTLAHAPRIRSILRSSLTNPWKVTARSSSSRAASRSSSGR